MFLECNKKDFVLYREIGIGQHRQLYNNLFCLNVRKRKSIQTRKEVRL